MRGFITEAHFSSAERQFPGIRRFYEALTDKPMTFLELVWKFTNRADGSASCKPRRASRRPA